MEATDNVVIKVKKLYDDSVIPFHSTVGSAGYDCVAHSIYDNQDRHLYEYGLGVAVEIPKGYVGLLFPRSSSADRGNLMANCVGVIDSDFRGEIVAKFKYGNCPYNVSEKVAQLVIVKLPNVEFNEVDELSSTERGTGGYGSTDAIAATV